MAGLGSLAALEGKWVLERRIKHAEGRTDFFSGHTRGRCAGTRLIQD